MPLKVIAKSLRIGSLSVSFQCDDGATTIVCGIMGNAFRDLSSARNTSLGGAWSP